MRTDLVDDLDGSPAQQTVTFGVDGDRYEIDLNQVHVELLRSQLARFIDGARPGPPIGIPAASARKHRRSRTATDRALPRQIRAWAAEQGIIVSERGRISLDVTERYRAARG